MNLDKHKDAAVARLQRDATSIHEDLAGRFRRHLTDTRDYTEKDLSLIMECLYTAIHEQMAEIGAHRARAEEHIQD